MSESAFKTYLSHHPEFTNNLMKLIAQLYVEP